ncbi:hypothetical protein Y1Q_0002374 [Alligator mississippiensis]|uniref:Uncharacterized protein n=1 Tax=Alligator mississippiensis TaxID=8496 RepID=A0A151MGZ6_ALLMI|nr:hypothetical protein Y1Q_0002374 [Alligator mississippiensis]
MARKQLDIDETIPEDKFLNDAFTIYCSFRPETLSPHCGSQEYFKRLQASGRKMHEIMGFVLQAGSDPACKGLLGTWPARSQAGLWKQLPQPDEGSNKATTIIPETRKIS